MPKPPPAAAAQARYLPWALGLSLVLFGSAQAQTAQDVQNEQLRRAQERESLQRQQQEIEPDVHGPTAPSASAAALPANENPCFLIQKLQLDSPGPADFSWLLAQADSLGPRGPSDPVQGRCLGGQGIQTVIDRLQNALIARGFVTSRVLAGPQNLQSGALVLSVLPGQVGDIRWAPGMAPRASLWNTVPARTGDLLNLRDIEQALENFKRVPSVEADIQITPGQAPGRSDLVIARQQATPLRLSATADDSGTRSTGTYQGSLTLSGDNALGLSDLFYLTLLHDLGGADPGARGTRGAIVHYSVPLGYWLASATFSSNRYHQTVAGASQDYLYSGTSRNAELKLSRMLLRDVDTKTSASLKGFQRKSNNAIDDTEIEVQRRVVAGLEWGLNHRRSWPSGSLEANASYRRGTGAWGSLPAPEEAFGEGTSRMKLWLLDATLQQSLSMAGQRLQYNGNWRAQYNQTPLTPQDRFAIGGRFTVRGFDGLSVLSAERGWLLRNEVATPLTPQLQGYVGLDAGHVSGPLAASLVGHHLSGGVLGLRGQWRRMQYEVFWGAPLSKPNDFRTSTSTAGFSVAMGL